MARVRTAKHPKPEEHHPEDESQEVPEPDGQATSKAEAVRLAVADGLDSPGDIVDFVKRRFNIDITKQMASSYKAQQKARDNKAAGGENRTRNTTQGGGIPAGFSSDVKELRSLIEKTGGAEELRDLIGQLSGLLGKYGATGLGELIDAIG